jgi:NAD(P)-dependent dehydrogenase (short-subunit alcohol dehydrogenase family)
MSDELAGQVAAVSIPDDELSTAITDRLVAAGARVHRIETAIAQYESGPSGLRQAITDVAAGEERLDVWVQATSEEADGPVASLDLQTWQTGLTKGISAVFAGTQAAGEIMRSQGNGAVVLLTSVDGFLASANRSVPCCGSAALMMLAKVLACEWATSGIRVNALATTTWLDPPLGPGAVELTAAGVSPSRIAMDRPPQAIEVADAVLYLASYQSSFVTGETLRVDGGWTAYHLF